MPQITAGAPQAGSQPQPPENRPALALPLLKKSRLRATNAGAAIRDFMGGFLLLFPDSKLEKDTTEHSIPRPRIVLTSLATAHTGPKCFSRAKLLSSRFCIVLPAPQLLAHLPKPPMPRSFSMPTERFTANASTARIATPANGLFVVSTQRARFSAA